MAGKARAARRAAGPQWTPEQVVELAVAHDLAEAERLIKECGYHRRDEELADAKRALLGGA